MQQGSKGPLFDSAGRLCVDQLTPAARETVDALERRMQQVDRGMYLPLDLMVVLLERDHREVARIVARETDGVVDQHEVVDRLRRLADDIDRDRDDDEDDHPRGETPELTQSNFSRGLTRIFKEARKQARRRGDEAVDEPDLVRCVVWRAEAVESASIRWAIRRLREGEGDKLFDERGLLDLQAFDSTCTGMLEGAMKLAASHGTSFLGTPHLIAMMASVRESVIWRSARERGLEPSRLREELIRLIGSKPEPIPEFMIGRKTLTPRMIRMLKQSVQQTDHDEVCESDLVEAFLDDGGSSLELLQALGLEEEIRTALGEPRVLAGAQSVEAAIEFASERRASPTLDMLGRDLTEEALQGELPSIVGRRRELTRVFNVLMRREQRNPLLIGEAGVGKTALAIGLAQHIANGRGPDQLRGHRVIEINGASLMSGTSYRGDLEARIESLIEEASRDVILFIDEAHAVFSPRSGSNTPAEVPNHFKRALASGKIAVIGATTEDEYRRWFEQDPALKRRFESIEIEEPSHSLTRDILESMVPVLQEEYGVEVDDEAIDHAIDLSVRYLPEESLPDKAKKLLMDACIGRANPLSETSRAGGETSDDREMDGKLPPVGRRAVAHQVHLKTSIPVERLLRGEISWWEGLQQRLRDAVVGQDDAMAQIAEGLVASRVKNADKQRPLSVLAFLGPSGVGKATAARAVAGEVFYDERALIRLDMTDYQQPQALSRLIGSPPGYVGYEDSDMLVTPLRKRPSSVVLLEDFDRAHPQIQDRLLRLLDEGQLGDTRGRQADATNAIFILSITTPEVRGTGQTIGFGESQQRRRDTLSRRLDDEPLAARLESRVDGVVSFAGLSEEGNNGAVALLDEILERFADNLGREYGVELEIESEAVDRLREDVAPLSKARDVEAAVDRRLVEPVSRRLLDGGGPERIVVGWDAGRRELVVDSG